MTQPPNPSRPAMTEAEREAMGSLADACERATGPDRELDVRVGLALGGAAYSESDVADMLRYRDEPTGYGRYRPADEYVPAYTASLDAAMTLVPDDWNISLRGVNDSWHVAMNATSFGPLRQAFGFAITPALALTAAALRARANQGTPA